jgi:hypothetical protein
VNNVADLTAFFAYEVTAPLFEERFLESPDLLTATFTLDG